MENEVMIREAQQRDADKISILCEQLSRAVAVADVAERLKVYTSNPAEYLFLVAEAGGEVVGFVCAIIKTEILSGPQARIDGVVVDLNFRGGGVGRKLMEAAEKWAKENSSVTMKLNSNIKRTETHKFYEKLGYTNAKMQYQFKKEL